MRVLIVVYALCTILLATASWALQDTSTIPVNRVKLLCGSSVTSYVSYNVKVTSGSLNGIYLSPQSNAEANQESLTNPSSNSTKFTILYDDDNSCAPSKFLINPPRKTTCIKGSVTPSKTVTTKEPYCIVLDNVNGTMPATVSTTYEFTNSRTGSSSGSSGGSSNSDGSSNGDGFPSGFFNTADSFKYNTHGYLLILAMATLIAYIL